jgi:hypothetical protein
MLEEVIPSGDELEEEDLALLAAPKGQAKQGGKGKDAPASGGKKGQKRKAQES